MAIYRKKKFTSPQKSGRARDRGGPQEPQSERAAARPAIGSAAKVSDCHRFSDIYISQGSVATYLRCDEIIKEHVPLVELLSAVW